MSDDRAASGSAKEVLDALFAFVEDPQEVASMSREDIRAYLKEEGINIDARKRELQRRLEAIKGRERLQRANEQRLQFQETFSAWKSKTVGNVTDTKAKLVSRLGTFGQNQPEQALAYFHKLEQASDADLERMLEDIEQLDTLNGEGDENGA